MTSTTIRAQEGLSQFLATGRSTNALPRRSSSLSPTTTKANKALDTNALRVSSSIFGTCHSSC